MVSSLGGEVQVIPPTSPGWEFNSPARPRRSLHISGSAARPAKRRRNACAALYSAGIGCSSAPLDGIPWCAPHNEERRKLYMIYKSHGASLESYPVIPVCSDGSTIATCVSLSLLRDWNALLRGKYNLITRCIEAREYFTRKFFGPDMDFGHKQYWEGLVRQRSEVEHLMSCIEKRGYQLILKNQNALWVLENDKQDSETCSGSLSRQSSLQSVDTIDTAFDEDPLESILRERAVQVREQIRLRLAWCCAPPTSRFYDERQSVVCAYVRRAVYQDASLMFISQNYDSVMSLLQDENLDLEATEKIRDAMSALCVHDVQSAVDDVIRSTDGDHVVVLGGRVFKDLSGERWPLHAWGHMTAFHCCYACLRTTCRTIEQVIDLTRYALLTQTPLHQPEDGLKYEFSVSGSKELVLAGFITEEIPLTCQRDSVISTQSSGCSETWEENQHALRLYAGLSLSEEAAQAFASACYRHPDFMVMLRKGTKAKIIRSTPVVWTSRRRVAASRSALDSAPWDNTKLFDSALEEARPWGWGRDVIGECTQLIVLDTTACTMSEFVQKLVGIWCQVHKVSNKGELYDKIKGPYDAAGELEPYEKVTRETAWEHYRRLWGCEPDPYTVLLEDWKGC